MYSVKVNQKEHQIFFNNINKTLAKGFFNEKPFDINTVRLEKNKYHLLYQNKGFIIEVFQQSKGVVKIKVNDVIHDVLINSPFEKIITTIGIQEKKEKNIKASMPGKVVNISVKAGDFIKIGDVILVLEAMKMENSIKSNLEGKIKKVLVRQNDTLTKNDILIELE
jgi:biotin carboxyl carrier protein